ncbi:MAG: hypothetical protein Q8R87_08795, partial [Anaerolineaceae bacterium]|nr:hypothetical protein [Anaerolineaceae bacterium]
LYYSDFPGQYSSVIVEDEVVIMANFILEDGNNLQLPYVISMFGDPQETTFSHYLQGSLTYLYPNLGNSSSLPLKQMWFSFTSALNRCP